MLVDKDITLPITLNESRQKHHTDSSRQGHTLPITQNVIDKDITQNGSRQRHHTNHIE